MNTVNKIIYIFLFIFIGMSAGFSQAMDKKIKAFVSILPLSNFVERVGGEQVDVSVLVGPGQNPATYEPTPQQMVKLSEAQIYFRIGVPFENAWMSRITRNNPDMKVVDLRKGIELRSMKSHHHHSHGENESAVHDEDGNDGGFKNPHTWLNPRLVKVQATTICGTLKELNANHAEIYQENLSQFHNDLDQLDQYIRQKMKDVRRRNFLVFHPAWGYFADAYHLEQIPIEIEGKEPTARRLAEAIQLAKRENIQTIFVQQQFNQSTAKAIARAIGGQVVTVDPLAENYLENMRDIADKFVEALR